MKQIILANIIGFILFVILAVIGVLDFIGIIELSFFIGIYIFYIFIVDVILFFMLLYYIPDSWIPSIRRIFYWFSGITVSLFVGIKLYELISGTIFVYSFQYQYFYLILVIYPTIMAIYFWRRNSNVRNTQTILRTVIAGSISIMIIVIHSFFLVLGGELVTPIYFEEQDRHIALVENSFLFSSNHRIFEYDNALFVTPVESEGSFSCHDGCTIGHPEIFTFTWIDDNTLEVSASQLYETVTFYFEEK